MKSIIGLTWVGVCVGVLVATPGAWNNGPSGNTELAGISVFPTGQQAKNR